MKILVTGGAGFIGSHVVDTFIANGHEVVVVDDLSTGRLSNLNPAATFYKVDIRSDELRAVFEKERPQVVDHHAAQMDVRRSVDDPLFVRYSQRIGELLPYGNCFLEREGFLLDELVKRFTFDQLHRNEGLRIPPNLIHLHDTRMVQLDPHLRLTQEPLLHHRIRCKMG